MNKKQLTMIWLGIVAVVGFAILSLLEGRSEDPALAVNSVLIFLSMETIIVVVTLRLVFTLAERKSKG